MLNFAAAGPVHPPIVTPLLREGGVWVKVEGAQHSGSVKYRLVYAKLKAAIALGTVAPGVALIEVTSGSTGVALAYLGRTLGLRVELHAFETIDPAKRARIREHGAELHLHPPTTPMTDLLARVAERVRGGGWWNLNQYDRRSTGLAYQPLGIEIEEQIAAAHGAPPRVFASPIGSGGLIQGLGGRFRRTYPGIQVIAVEPEPGKSVDGMRNTQITFIGNDDPYDRSFPEDRITVAAPLERATVQGHTLGWSATAVLEAVRARGWNDVLTIAAD